MSALRRPASKRADYDEDFRTDYKTRYANRGQSYDYYAPAYQFGSTYANDQRYRDRDWNIVESDLRRDWEAAATANGRTSKIRSATDGIASAAAVDL